MPQLEAKFDSALPERRYSDQICPDDVAHYKWYMGSVSISQFFKPIATKPHTFPALTQSDWEEWMRTEEAYGYDFSAVDFDPIVVTYDKNGDFTLWDGWHRTALHVTGGCKRIRAIIGVERVNEVRNEV